MKETSNKKQNKTKTKPLMDRLLASIYEGSRTVLWLSKAESNKQAVACGVFKSRVLNCYAPGPSSWPPERSAGERQRARCALMWCRAKGAFRGAPPPYQLHLLLC